MLVPRGLLVSLSLGSLLAGCGRPPDGSDGGSPPDAAVTAPHHGEVMLTGFPRGAGAQGGAAFYTGSGIVYDDTGTSPVVLGCAAGSAGHCVARVEHGCPSPPDGMEVSAGTVTLGGSAGSAIELMPTSGATGLDLYPSAPERMAGWNDGDTVTVMGIGTADVPAFMGSLVFPSAPTVTAPAASSTVDRTADLPVAWQPLAHGDLYVVVTDMRADTVACTFPGGDGSGTIPASLLSQLMAGGGGISVAAQSTGSVIAGDWAVTLIARQSGEVGSGSVTIR